MRPHLFFECRPCGVNRGSWQSALVCGIHPVVAVEWAEVLCIRALDIHHIVTMCQSTSVFKITDFSYLRTVSASWKTQSCNTEGKRSSGYLQLTLLVSVQRYEGDRDREDALRIWQSS